MSENCESYFLGFDLSTQTLKGTIIDGNNEIVCEASVDPEVDLPFYDTVRSHYHNKVTDEVTTPLLMWVEAIELALTRLMKVFPDFSKIKAISGGAQQCGSVYWKKNVAETALSSLDASSSLVDQLQDCFTVKTASIWLDSSSGPYCEKLVKRFGADTILNITGYVPTLGLAGPRVLKTILTNSLAYADTERISMMSSFACSLFLGKLAPTDYQDGITMMLFDFHQRRWSPYLCDNIDFNLRQKLGPIVPSSTVLGNISPYFVKRYRFSPKCKIVAWTGDNGGSIVGSGICHGDVFLTTGTGDCLEFLSNDQPVCSKKGGFMFINPLDHTTFAYAIGWKNAALARDKVRKQCGFQTWEEFENAVAMRPPGNNGNMGIYLFEPDVMPLFAHGVVRQTSDGAFVDSFDAATECRAILESQLISRRYDSEELGLKLTKNTRLLLTGGPSKSPSIRQITADVFGVPVYGMETVNSCSYGGALRASYALSGRTNVDPEISTRKWILLAQPRPEFVKVYAKLIKRYASLVEPLVPPYFVS